MLWQLNKYITTYTVRTGSKPLLDHLTQALQEFYLLYSIRKRPVKVMDIYSIVVRLTLPLPSLENYLLSAEQ